MESFKKIFELKFASLAPDVIEELARLPRTGWLRRGIKNPESVQEHIVSLRELAVSLFNSLPELSEQDRQDILDMLEVHDWPEAIAGDQVILEKDKNKDALRKEKFEIERQAMMDISKKLGVKGEEIFRLWLRFEEGQDEPASFAGQLDKYQAIEKAFQYESEGEKVSTLEFIENAEKDIKHPILVQRLSELRHKLK